MVTGEAHVCGYPVFDGHFGLLVGPLLVGILAECHAIGLVSLMRVPRFLDLPDGASCRERVKMGDLDDAGVHQNVGRRRDAVPDQRGPGLKERVRPDHEPSAVFLPHRERGIHQDRIASIDKLSEDDWVLEGLRQPSAAATGHLDVVDWCCPVDGTGGLATAEKGHVSVRASGHLFRWFRQRPAASIRIGNRLDLEPRFTHLIPLMRVMKIRRGKAYGCEMNPLRFRVPGVCCLRGAAVAWCVAAAAVCRSRLQQQ